MVEGNGNTCCALGPLLFGTPKREATRPHQASAKSKDVGMQVQALQERDLIARRHGFGELTLVVMDVSLIAKMVMEHVA